MTTTPPMSTTTGTTTSPPPTTTPSVVTTPSPCDTTSQYTCENGECILDSKKCDGECDCADSCDDESDCGVCLSTYNNYIFIFYYYQPLVLH